MPYSFYRPSSRYCHLPLFSPFHTLHFIKVEFNFCATLLEAYSNFIKPCASKIDNKSFDWDLRIYFQRNYQVINYFHITNLNDIFTSRKINLFHLCQKLSKQKVLCKHLFTPKKKRPVNSCKQLLFFESFWFETKQIVSSKLWKDKGQTY